MGNPLRVKGLIRCDLIFVCNENVLYRELYNFYVLCVNCLNVLIDLGVFPVTSQILEFCNFCQTNSIILLAKG